MDINKFYSICLQGNVIKAIEYLKAYKNKTNDIIQLEKQYEERFISNSEVYEINSDELWIKDVINSYIQYFKNVLTNNSITCGENALIRNLSQLLNITYDLNLDEIEKRLENRFKEKGYSFLGGVTEPYRGPYIWKNTLKKEFKVKLPFSSENVTVYFISEFLLLGWIDFATIGRHYPGGWAKEEGLYYVNKENKKIDFNSSEFQVSFLKHEAQHLSDYKKFSNLESEVLEYRAKLTELIYYPEAYNLIKKFLYEAKNNKCLPHSYASYSIIRKLSSLIFKDDYVFDKQKWKGIDEDIISNMAYKLLLQNNKYLEKSNNSTGKV